MSFIESVYWTITPGREQEHDELMRKWSEFVEEHQEELFPEWVSARYYAVKDIQGQSTGRYLMVFEYDSVEGYHAYKERRKDFTGPYAPYKLVDPYQTFDVETITKEYLEPKEQDLWLEFGAFSHRGAES